MLAMTAEQLATPAKIISTCYINLRISCYRYFFPCETHSASFTTSTTFLLPLHYKEVRLRRRDILLAESEIKRREMTLSGVLLLTGTSEKVSSFSSLYPS